MALSASPSTFSITPASLSDASAISSLGRLVWHRAFGWSISNPADCDAYLDQYYTPEAWERELSAPAHSGETFFARSFAPASESEIKSEDQILGFVQLKRGTTEPCLSSIEENGKGKIAEVHRLYVGLDAQGKGVGRALLRCVEEKVKGEGVEYLWLGVWEHNETARRLYQGMGYEKWGEHDFVIGTERQVDWVMVKKL